MKENRVITYDVYLSTIVNSRLIYNTIEEYEEKLDNHSLHNNGVRRCLNTTQKLRTAFRDFQIETLKLTHDQLDLETVLSAYKDAWTFYQNNLSRRSHPESLVLELLQFYYPPFTTHKLTKSKLLLFDSIVEESINVPILILLILKVLPGFDSKEGNIYSISRFFEKVISLLEEFTKGNGLFSVLPSIIQAREEEHKSRITLIYHTSHILDMYAAYIDSDNLYEQSTAMKQSSITLELEGYWNQCSGTLNSTIFWNIEHALNEGSYFVTYWHKDSQNVLTGIKYNMYLSETEENKLMAYILHPQAIKHRIKGLPYTDRDNVWYETKLPATAEPQHLNFTRLMNSNSWPKTFNIVRVDDKSICDTYDKWMKTCEIKMMYKDLDYYFLPNLYAATLDALYIPADEDHYYKVPRDSFPGLENIQLGDLVGLMTMGKKQYIVFDELLLYIETNKEQLSKFNIEIVDSIK